VDPRAGLNDMEKRKFFTLPGLELRRLGGPAHCQSLYRLCYPGSWKNHIRNTKIREEEYFKSKNKILKFIKKVKSLCLTN
jgi:hypothetical protein